MCWHCSSRPSPCGQSPVATRLYTGIWLALAMDSKPTALGFAMLLFALPRQSWLRAGLWCAGLVAVAWLPFFIGNADSFAATGFAIPNQPASALRWLGVGDAETPGWDRPAQAALSLVLGGIAVWRKRWTAVVLLGANARIVLDPSVYTYYTASVLLGTLLWDVIGQQPAGAMVELARADRPVRQRLRRPGRLGKGPDTSRVRGDLHDVRTDVAAAGPHTQARTRAARTASGHRTTFGAELIRPRLRSR